MDYNEMAVTYGVSALTAKAAYDAVNGGLMMVDHLLPVALSVPEPTVAAWSAALVGLTLKWLHKRMVPAAPAKPAA